MVYLFFAFAVFVVLVAVMPREDMKMIVVGMWVVAVVSGVASFGYEFLRRL